MFASNLGLLNVDTVVSNGLIVVVQDVVGDEVGKNVEVVKVFVNGSDTLV